MKRKRTVFALLALGMACSDSEDFHGTMPDYLLPEYQSCDADADCVAVGNGCCCSTVAIREDLVDEFNDAKGTCVAQCEALCDAAPEARCENKKCTLDNG